MDDVAVLGWQPRGNAAPSTLCIRLDAALSITPPTISCVCSWRCWSNDQIKRDWSNYGDQAIRIATTAALLSRRTALIGSLRIVAAFARTRVLQSPQRSDQGPDEHWGSHPRCLHDSMAPRLRRFVLPHHLVCVNNLADSLLCSSSPDQRWHSKASRAPLDAPTCAIWLAVAIARDGTGIRNVLIACRAPAQRE